MKLPRDVGGEELAALLDKYGYGITRADWQPHQADLHRQGHRAPHYHSETQTAKGGHFERHSQ